MLYETPQRKNYERGAEEVVTHAVQGTTTLITNQRKPDYVVANSTPIRGNSYPSLHTIIVDTTFQERYIKKIR